MTGLLEGVRVVETGVLMSVDYLGRLLGDEGADVVKVESPKVGDYLRNIATRFAPDWSTFHLILNRNKRSIGCDLRTPEGGEIIRSLIARCDVFITGNIADTNRKLGLDYESVRSINPSIVYCQTTGFGAFGPYAEIPTHGHMMDALGGGAPPMRRNAEDLVEPVGEAVTSSGGVVVGPLYGAFGVAAALVRSGRTGEGAYLDVSGADAVLAVKWISALQMLNPGLVDPTQQGGGSTSTSAKYQYYETKDRRYILFCAIEPKFWRNWCQAAGRVDLLERHRQDTVVDFGKDDGALRQELQRTFLTRTATEWIEMAARHDIALGPALRFDEVVDDPQLRAREQIVTEDHPVFGAIRTLGNPILVPDRNFSVRSAPSHGQHTDEVLDGLGYDAARRQSLRDAGVIK